jgi:hypothetical protein
MFDTWGDYEFGTAPDVPAAVLDRVGFDSLPEGLAEMEPGAELGIVLNTIDRKRLDGADRVVVLQAWNRQVAHAQAELYASMVDIVEAEANVYAGRDGFDINEAAASEVRAALILTRRSADYHLGLARQLVEDYPVLWSALHRGHVDLPKARVIVNETSHLDRVIADHVTELALERAHRQTTGQLRARLQKLVIGVDPDSAKGRYEESVAQRRVISEPTEAGTANVFGLDLPVADSNSAMRRINRLAKAMRKAGDPRTMDQIRADIFLDLLNGRDKNPSQGQGGTVDLRVDLSTLAELDDSPAEIPGWGPVIADIARKVVEEQDDAEWRFTVTDPENGQVVHSGITRRRPTAAQRRRVEAHYPACVFYTCRMSSFDCDIDHRKAFAAGGPTDDANLAPLCRSDHRLKHSGWQVEMITPGVFVWTSPLGVTYVVEAEPP